MRSQKTTPWLSKGQASLGSRKRERISFEPDARAAAMVDSAIERPLSATSPYDRSWPRSAIRLKSPSDIGVETARVCASDTARWQKFGAGKFGADTRFVVGDTVYPLTNETAV